MASLYDVLLVAAAVGSGLVGGLFFAFSTFVMRAFDRLPAAQAIAAMQSINITVLHPTFFCAFFGTAAAAVALAVIAAATDRVSTSLIVVGGAVYVLGSIVVTILFNVPLNDALARVDVRSENPESAWAKYRRPWTRWNHVRTTTSLAAAAVFCAAIGIQ